MREKIFIQYFFEIIFEKLFGGRHHHVSDIDYSLTPLLTYCSTPVDKNCIKEQNWTKKVVILYNVCRYYEVNINIMDICTCIFGKTA